MQLIKESKESKVCKELKVSKDTLDKILLHRGFKELRVFKDLLVKVLKVSKDRQVIFKGLKVFKDLVVHKVFKD